MQNKETFLHCYCQLHMSQIICQKEVCTKQAEPVKLRKTCSTSSAMVQKDPTFTESIKMLINYADVVELVYSVVFVDTGMKDIVDVIVLYKSRLHAQADRTFGALRFPTCFSKKRATALFHGLFRGVSSAENLDISCLDSSFMYSSVIFELQLVIEAADCFMKHPSGAPPSTWHQFTELQSHHYLSRGQWSLENNVHPMPLPSVMTVKLQGSQILVRRKNIFS